jgi:glutamate-1-semialdehyde 2,1-aminomutase
VPFQFSPRVAAELPAASFVAASAGVQVTDLDGTARYDLAGSYGVNLLGYDFYKGCMERGARRVAGLGPVLGAYPSLVADNAARLARISGKQEVSFHMSGTEAVMQAVRLARYHTGAVALVRLCGAYHGWWGDVQPGVGNPVPPHETYTLADMSREARCRAAHAARHRLRAGQSGAGAAPEQRARRFRPWSAAGANRGVRPRGLHRLAEERCARSAPSAASC